MKPKKKVIYPQPLPSPWACLQLLIHNGYGKAQASDLVKRCEDLTLPGEPSKRCTSLKQWVEQILMKHPPSDFEASYGSSVIHSDAGYSTDCL
jgi:hypothetical protein